MKNVCRQPFFPMTKMTVRLLNDNCDYINVQYQNMTKKTRLKCSYKIKTLGLHND